MTEHPTPPFYDKLKVESDRFIPLEHITYGDEDPHAHLVPIQKIYDVKVDGDYPYEDNSFYYKFRHFLYYLQSRTLIKFLNYFRYGFRRKGYENIKNNKELLKHGAVTVCNHVFRWDMCGILDSTGWSQVRFPIFRDQLEGKDRDRMIYTGGVPIPEKLADMRKFFQAFDHFHEKGYWIHVFAEESRWEFYTPIRPFKKGAFTFAERYNMPIVPMAYSYRERKGILKWFGKEACVTLNIGEPILPDPALKGNRAATIDDLRRRTHEAMVKLAGITENPWTYNQTEK